MYFCAFIQPCQSPLYKSRSEPLLVAGHDHLLRPDLAVIVNVVTAAVVAPAVLVNRVKLAVTAEAPLVRLDRRRALGTKRSAWFHSPTPTAAAQAAHIATLTG